MGVEVLEKNVEERLSFIQNEFKEIILQLDETDPLNERLKNLNGVIQNLVNETLSWVPSSLKDQLKVESGVVVMEHRSNKASYGGVPELFMSPLEQQLHKHTVSFGGFHQLFDVEMDDFNEVKPDGEANGHDSPVLSPSPTYADVHRLFMDGPLQGNENYIGISDMFQTGTEGIPQKFGEKRKNLGKEFDPTGRNHDRSVSIGGVRQLQDFDDVDMDLFESAKVEDGVESNKTPGGPEPSDSHTRSQSFGGARQLIEVECDTFSDVEVDEEEKETSPKALVKDQGSNGNDDHAPDGHDRTVSIGGVRQLSTDELQEEDLDFDGEPKEPKVDLEDDHSEAAEANDRSGPVVEDTKEDSQAHDRNVSIGGVRTLQVFDLGLDDLDDNMEGKPRELFDGHGTVEDPSGHERRRSNLQDGRELFEDRNEEKVSTFDPIGGDSYHDSQSDGRTKMQDLKREHLQLKMSKIELIKSTAEEIDRLRGIIKTLASQLRHINEVHNKLLNATLGGQMLDSVFGAFTGFFSAPSEPSVQRNRN